MATLKDVARETGLTVSTVSRVLNNRGYISENARQNVYAAMKKLNYQPNEMARSLSNQKSNMIGIITPHIVQPYFAKMISCLEQAAYERKHRILLFNSKDKGEIEDECIELCKSNRVASVILCSASFHTEKFMNLDFPLITLERFLDEGTAVVECDNYRGGVLAAEHLIDRGCRHILHIGGVNQQSMPADMRRAGFEEVCARRSVDFTSIYQEEDMYVKLDYYDVIRNALADYPKTDGIFASSDVIAAQAIQVCGEKSIVVPDQMKIVGYDDVGIASLTTPCITTIHQPVKEMADAAIDIAIRAAAGEMVPTRSVFPVRLIERSSTAGRKTNRR